MIIYNKFFSYAMFCLSFGLFFTGNINARFEQEKDGVQLMVQEYINEEIPIIPHNSESPTVISRARLDDMYPVKLTIKNESNHEILLSPQNINLPQASLNSIKKTYNSNEDFFAGIFLNVLGLTSICLGYTDKKKSFSLYCTGVFFICFSVLAFEMALDSTKKIQKILEAYVLVSPLFIMPGKTAITFIFADKKDPRLNPFTVTFFQKDNSEEKIEFNVIL